jgi:hypothetical protein
MMETPQGRTRSAERIEQSSAGTMLHHGEHREIKRENTKQESRKTGKNFTTENTKNTERKSDIPLLSPIS